MAQIVSGNRNREASSGLLKRVRYFWHELICAWRSVCDGGRRNLETLMLAKNNRLGLAKCVEIELSDLIKLSSAQHSSGLVLQAKC